MDSNSNTVTAGAIREALAAGDLRTASVLAAEAKDLVDRQGDLQQAIAEVEQAVSQQPTGS
ncbi:MAG: DUF1843 domain-containing protein [Candidatus Competibacteraceae bacterium]|nr:DUF1843 domain-containing protein [Candidatus Competibacteraceae bacterium]